MPPVSSITNAFSCAHCSAQLRTDAAVCWLCHTPVDPHPEASLAAAHAQPNSPISERGFSLASLLMLTTLLAVVLGMFSVSPGMGLLATFTLVPAALRASWEIQRRKRQGQATTIDEKAVVFAASLGMVVVAGVAAAIAFNAACWGGTAASAAVAPPEGYGVILVGAVVGGIIGAVLAVWVFYRVMKALAPKDYNKPSSWLLVSGICIFIALALLLWYLETSGFIDWN